MDEPTFSLAAVLVGSQFFALDPVQAVIGAVNVRSPLLGSFELDLLLDFTSLKRVFWSEAQLLPCRWGLPS